MNNLLPVLFVTATLLLSGCSTLPKRLVSPDRAIREEAFHELLTSPEISLGEARRAVSAVSDNKERNQLAIEAKSEPVRMFAVTGITDQRFLQSIINNLQESKAVRAEAVRHINDVSLLENIARTDDDLTVRFAAIETIDNPVVLKNVFKAAKSWAEYTFIADRVADSTTAKDYENAKKWRSAAKNSSGQSRMDAIGHLKGGRDDDVLGMIACGNNIRGWDPNDDIRLAAIKKLENQWDLKRLAIADVSSDNRFAAAMRITNQNYLQEVVYRARVRWASSGHGSNEFNEYVSLLSRVTDSSVLKFEFMKILLNVNDYSSYPLFELCERLDDQDLLELVLICIERKRQFGFIRAAIPQISDQIALGQLATRTDNSERGLAISRLTDISLLTKIASSDKDASIKKAAKKRLGEMAFASGHPSKENVLKAARGEFGEEYQLRVLSLPNVAKEEYATAFKGFLSREGGGWGTDYNQDAEIIRKCPYDELVQWVASNINSIVHHDRGYWDARNAKEELVRRGLYSKEQLEDENFKHDAVRDFLFGQ